MDDYKDAQKTILRLSDAYGLKVDDGTTTQALDILSAVAAAVAVIPKSTKGPEADLYFAAWLDAIRWGVAVKISKEAAGSRLRRLAELACKSFLQSEANPWCAVTAAHKGSCSGCPLVIYDAVAWQGSPLVREVPFTRCSRQNPINLALYEVERAANPAGGLYGMIAAFKKVVAAATAPSSAELVLAGFKADPSKWLP